VAEWSVAAKDAESEWQSCDPLAGYPRIDWDYGGIGSAPHGRAVALMQVPDAPALRLEVHLDSSISVDGSFDLEPRARFLPARSRLDVQAMCTVREADAEFVETVLVGRGALASDGRFSLQGLPLLPTRVVGLQAWVDPEAATRFNARLVEGLITRREDASVVEPPFEFVPRVGKTRGLDIRFHVADEEGKSLPITELLTPGKELKIEIRQPVLGAAHQGPKPRFRRAWIFSVPPSDVVRLEGIPVEPFGLFVDSVAYGALADDLDWIQDSPDGSQSDLNGVYMRTFRRGEENLNVSVEVRVRRRSR
jgi:hypothetical protein